jgi:hypothetical protein
LTKAEEAFLREAAFADYVDFCFASRLVHGMQKRQSMTHDISLRYENQALIDHIVATRQNRSLHRVPTLSAMAAFPTMGSRKYNRTAPERTDSNEKLRWSSLNDEVDVQREDTHEDEDEDQMIFEMEL